MNNEIYAFALKNALDEIQNLCPDITNSFMLKKDGEIVAGDKNTPENVVKHVVDAFDGILEKADAIGGVENIIFEGSKGTANVSSMGDFYLVTVTSTKADLNYVNTVTNVLIPTVLKLVEKIHSTSIKSSLPASENEPEAPPTTESAMPLEESEETETEKYEEAWKPETKPESLSAEPESLSVEPLSTESPVNQLIVETLGGLFVPSDTVRMDRETLSEWEQLYEGRKVEKVEIESFNGKSMQCKARPLKDWKYEGKGIIRMPEKTQLALDIKKGELVRVKPIIE